MVCRYVCALTSCMLQASYLLLVEKSGAEKGIGSTELLYYNALLSLPFILGVRSHLAHAMCNLALLPTEL